MEKRRKSVLEPRQNLEEQGTTPAKEMTTGEKGKYSVYF